MTKSPEQRYRDLLDGRMSATERGAMQRELETPEAEMAEYLNSCDPDELERDLREGFDRALPSCAPLEPEESEVLYARIRPAVSGSARGRPAQRARARVLGWAGASFVLGAAAASVLLLPTSRFTEKAGPPVQRPAQIRLMFNVGHREPGRPIVIERGVPGSTVPAHTDVLLRYRVAKAGHVCLVHREPSGELEVIAPSPLRLESGWHDLRADGRVQAVALEGMVGKHTFFALWRAQPPGCPDNLKVIPAGRAGGDTLIDSFDIEVAP